MYNVSEARGREASVGSRKPDFATTNERQGPGLIKPEGGMEPEGRMEPEGGMKPEGVVSSEVPRFDWKVVV